MPRKAFSSCSKGLAISIGMKYVITVTNISIGLTQCGLISGLRRDDFIMTNIIVGLQVYVPQNICKICFLHKISRTRF